MSASRRDRFICQPEEITVISEGDGNPTLLPEVYFEIGRERIFAGDDPEDVALDLAIAELALTQGLEDGEGEITGKGSGNFAHKGRKGQAGGSGKGTGSAGDKVRNERSLRALKAFIPIHAESQRHAEANELSVRRMVGGKRTDDNKPVDVITTIGGKLKGIEVKTMVNNTNDKITMRKAAIEKKIRWARANHATTHTVVIDDRGKLGNPGFSGHRLYYRKGPGSFRLSSMVKVNNAAHLKELLEKS